MGDDAFATVRLRDEQARLEATFVPGAGMLCCSLRHRGDELLAQNSGVSAYAEQGTTMGIPLLYPWANRLAGFHYTVAGRTVACSARPRPDRARRQRPADPRRDRRPARVGAGARAGSRGSGRSPRV